MSYKTAIIAHNDSGSTASKNICSSCNEDAACQSFTTPAKTKFITKVLENLVPPTGGCNISCDMYLADVSHHPTGDSLGSKTINVPCLVEGNTVDAIWEFDSPIPALPNTLYVFMLSGASPSARLVYTWTGSTYSLGQADFRQRIGGTWECSVNYDLRFDVWGLVKRSNTFITT